MRVSAFKDGLALRVITGTYSILLGIDLQPDKRVGCLGFSIQRTDFGPKILPFAPDKRPSRWLPNLLRFPQDTQDAADGTTSTTDRSPLQNFRWGDWTGHPGQLYRYTVTAQYGKWNQLVAGPSVSVDVMTEDPDFPETAVFFNRGAAASNAYNVKFGDKDPDKLPPDLQKKAYIWLSRGLEEAVLAFLAQAKDSTFGLHAAIYEFQKENLLQGLKDAVARGVDVKAVYHYRKGGKTLKLNEAAAAKAGLDAVCVRRQAASQSAISHNKFVVLLQNGVPVAVWTGSTNWTDGGIYGQLNVGHAVYDPGIAQAYEILFQQLHADLPTTKMKDILANLTPVPDTVPSGPCIMPIFSPQGDKKMLNLYGKICKEAKSLLVCAPFELAEEILDNLSSGEPGVLRFILIDKNGSLGSKQYETAIAGDSGNQVSTAITLKSPLHDFQNKLLQGKESFHHAGIHIHSKIIAADPLGPDPIIVMGSANFSDNSTLSNDSNTLILRGYTPVADIYVTEFMRMFEHYYFRGKQAEAEKAAQEAHLPVKPLQLAEDDTWSEKFYVPGSQRAYGRMLFAGTDASGMPDL